MEDELAVRMSWGTLESSHSLAALDDFVTMIIRWTMCALTVGGGRIFKKRHIET